MRIRLLMSLLPVAGFLLSGTLPAATLQPLIHQPPVFVDAGPPFLLTDGTVMFQGDSYTDWWKLTPDASGNYLNGTWTELASLPAAWNYGPYACASAVLADGRVLIEGGEYNLGGPFSLTNKGAIYDPVADSWTQVDPPPGWDYIGDSASIVMPNGKFLLGDKLTMRIAELDPATLSWTELGSDGKADFNAEEGWTLLPDGSFITVDVLDMPNTERYVYTDAPDAGVWTSLGSTPESLAWNYHLPPISFGGGTYTPPGETGQCILRPDATVFCTGASDDQPADLAHTAIYDSVSMTWASGPDFPAGDDAGDTSAVLLPSGNVLVSSASGRLYEFDGSSLTPGPSGGGLLVTLPSGQAIVNGSEVRIYTPDATPVPDPSWAPTITDWPTTLAPGATYVISGTQFNGLSQAQAFGDELQAPTNYPLVQITNNATGDVTYARTHDHSSMGVATGDLPVSTSFDVPATIEPGTSSLVVVANGIASPSVCVSVLRAADEVFTDGFDGGVGCTR
ncbi:MAG: kelch repeat-containing protein [Rhodanobacteraceae bacterium]